MDNDSYISFTGESGNKPNISLEIAEKYCQIEEHIDETTDGKYKMYGFNPDINKKCYDEEKQNGTKKGRISTYLLKYKNARFKVVIKSLGAILGITILGIIYYYVKNTRDQLVPVMSEGGGGENSSKIPVSETLSENLETVRQATIQNLKKFLGSGDNVQKYPDLLEVLRALSLGEDIKGNIQKLQNQEYSRLVGNGNTCYIKAGNNPS